MQKTTLIILHLILNYLHGCLIASFSFSSDKLKWKSSDNSVISLMDEISVQSELSPSDAPLKEIDLTPAKISKNQLKRSRKQERWEQIKILKKEKKKEEKAIKKAADSPDMLTSSSVQTRNFRCETSDERKVRKEKDRQGFLDRCHENYATVIDCSWEDDHREGPLKSLAQQVLFCYGINKRTSHPSYIYLTGLGPRMKEQLSKNHVSEWLGVTNTTDDYLNVVKDKQLVYLTSDSPDTLDELDPKCAYIIGGIVDRNSLKGISFDKAKKQGIRTAKLPLKEYCKMKGSPVLTVNHVFEIMIRFRETGSWEKAFEIVLPQRKGLEIPCRSTSPSDGYDGGCDDGPDVGQEYPCTSKQQDLDTEGNITSNTLDESSTDNFK